MTVALAIFTLFGHGFLWVGLMNRLHAYPIPRWIIELLSAGIFLIIGAGPVAFVVWWWCGRPSPLEAFQAAANRSDAAKLLLLYFLCCWLAGAGTIARWLWQNLHFRQPPQLLRSHERRNVAISPAAAALHPSEHVHHRSTRWPRNQALTLELTERTIEIPRLPAALDGLRILHLSDFHLNGRLGKAYFREVVRIGNELQPDLTALTGDFVDASACIDWLPETFGQLRAKYGVYFVLGNHDIYVEPERVRRVLSASGAIDLGGRWIELAIGGETVVLAGNELPWIAPAADFGDAKPSAADGGPVRIVLAHTPDQIEWARDNEVDLMLCGHTHGGQIRFPLVGAILTPSRYGVKFDCGLFYIPPTVMHVTRGVAGKQSLRWHCPPEIALITLRSPR